MDKKKIVSLFLMITSDDLKGEKSYVSASADVHSAPPWHDVM